MKPPWPLPTHLDLPANCALATLLARRRLSAHSDLADALACVDQHLAASAPEIAFERFCPSPAEYAYELRAAPTGTVYLLAHGMHGLSLRLPRGELEAALLDGATPERVLGEGWAHFDVFGPAPLDPLLRWSARALSAANTVPPRDVR